MQSTCPEYPRTSQLLSRRTDEYFREYFRAVWSSVISQKSSKVQRGSRIETRGYTKSRIECFRHNYQFEEPGVGASGIQLATREGHSLILAYSGES
jgi:hypothetical protein